MNQNDTSPTIDPTTGNDIPWGDRVRHDDTPEHLDGFRERKAPDAATILARMPGLVYLFDLVTNSNVFTNKDLAATLGYTTEEAQAMGAGFLPAVMHPDDWMRYPEHMREIFDAPSGREVQFDYRLRHKQNAWVFVAGYSAVYARDDTGHPTVVIGVVHVKPIHADQPPIADGTPMPHYESLLRGHGHIAK